MPTKISWTDETWNPFRAQQIVLNGDQPPTDGRVGWFCEKVSAGCDHCYAESFNIFRGNGAQYNPDGKKDLELYVDVETLLAPLRWKRPRRIFPCSMTDWMLRHYPDAWIEAMLGVAILADRHVFQFLTKRSGRQRDVIQRIITEGGGSEAGDESLILCVQSLRALVAEYGSIEQLRFLESITKTAGVRIPMSRRFPPPNIWFGVSIEAPAFCWRADDLADTPAALRWWSLEPWLGGYERFARTTAGLYMERGQVDWIVIGGESGQHARPFPIADARAMIDDADRHEIAVYMKQLGAKPVGALNGNPAPVRATGKGDDPYEWPADLRRQHWPDVKRV